jgi:hypothetical protein
MSRLRRGHYALGLIQTGLTNFIELSIDMLQKCAVHVDFQLIAWIEITRTKNQKQEGAEAAEKAFGL